VSIRFLHAKACICFFVFLKAFFLEKQSEKWGSHPKEKESNLFVGKKHDGLCSVGEVYRERLERCGLRAAESRIGIR